jgi:hypothetical protein
VGDLGCGDNAPFLLNAPCQRVGAELARGWQGFGQLGKIEGWFWGNKMSCRLRFDFRFHPHRHRPATMAFEKCADASLVAPDAQCPEMINDLLPALPLPAHLRDECEVWREFRLKRFSGHVAGKYDEL